MPVISIVLIVAAAVVLLLLLVLKARIIVMGLGAIFGQVLESSGGAHSLAEYMLKKFGQGRASWAMMLTGFIIAMETEAVLKF